MKSPTLIKRTITFIVSSLALSMTLSATDVSLLNQSFTTTEGGNPRTIAPSMLPGSGPDQRGGFINGALFRRTEPIDNNSSGSGQFRDLYNLQDTGTELGYNRSGALDASVPNGFNPFLTKGQLAPSAGGGYYVFVVDTNDGGSLLSLDAFEIYSGGSWTDTDSDGVTEVGEVTEAWGANALPQTVAALASYTTLIYDMDAGQNSTVFVDSSLSTGSGTFDVYIFVPVSLFANVTNNTMLYVYTEFGAFSPASLSFTTSSGPEQVSAYKGTFLGIPPDPSIPIPEPSTSLLSGLGVLLLLCRRSRA